MGQTETLEALRENGPMNVYDLARAMGLAQEGEALNSRSPSVSKVRRFLSRLQRFDLVECVRVDDAGLRVYAAVEDRRWARTTC